MDILSPGGPVGLQEKHLIIVATMLMLLVAGPVIVLTLFFAWRYRAGGRAVYAPDQARSPLLEVFIWGGPVVIVACLGVIEWTSTHALDPYRALPVAVGEGAPLTVDVVALDWKWLFIYPDLHVAAVNELALPVNTPVTFNITSDSVMNGFFIPSLGTQIYAMAGMQTRLHLLASRAGDYTGMSAVFSGPGFASMQFRVRALAPGGFTAWVAAARRGAQRLTPATYAALSRPQADLPVAYYTGVDDRLFAEILQRHNNSMMAGRTAGTP